jgi:prephenate dehydrogenase
LTQLFKHIAIAGLGLIGGSLARDIRQRGLAGRITGCGRNPERMQQARDLGLVDDYVVGFSRELGDADLVIVGTPVRAITRTIQDLAPCLQPGTIVTDVGSVKAPIVAGAEAVMPPGVFFVGGHPIAGTENSGFEASVTGLFENRICVLTPTAASHQEALARLEGFWKSVGSRVIRMDVQTHDRIFAGISHLPHMVAFSLVNALVDMRGFDLQILQYSAGGFRDFTRIAASDPVMWRDIALLNRENIVSALEVFERTLHLLKQAITAGDENTIERFFQKSRDTRREIT